MIHIQHTADLRGETPYTAWFLYGDTGSGKTVAASTFPDPIFLVPANENSYVSLLEHGASYPFVVIGKDVVTGKTLRARQHLMQVLDYLEEQYHKAIALQTAGDDAGALKAFPYQTIVVESLTHLVDLVVEDVSDYGRKRMDQATWGLISTFLRTLHDRLRALDVHVVYTALAQVKEVKGADASRGMPGISGSMAEKMPSACDVIGFCEEVTTPKGGAVYRMHFRKYGLFQARTRFRRMPKFVDNFNFADVEPFLVSNEEEQQLEGE